MSIFNLFGKSGNDLSGRLARTTTPLRSMGFISIDGKSYEAMSTQGFIPEGSLVKITGYSLGNLTVEAA